MTEPGRNSPPTTITEPIGDSWKTQELRDAEAKAEETALKSDELIEKADQLPIPPADNPTSEEKVAAIKAAAEARDAPPEMRVLREKVDKGLLTWEDVLAGKAYNDPDVRAAMASKMEQMREIYAEFEAGHTLDEVLEAHGVDPTQQTQQQAAPVEEPSASDYDDDDEWDEDDRLQKAPPPPEPSAPPSATPAPEEDDDDWDDDRFQNRF